MACVSCTWVLRESTQDLSAAKHLGRKGQAKPNKTCVYQGNWKKNRQEADGKRTVNINPAPET